MVALVINYAAQAWPLATAFVISRGAKTQADVMVIEASLGAQMGRGECVPYARYGETIASVSAQIEAARHQLNQAGDQLAEPAAARQRLQTILPAGAARNGLDCALWDLEAKCAQTSVAALSGQATPPSTLTAFTLSLGTPDDMARAARQAAALPLLKLKLGGAGDGDRMRAVRAARPDARLMADANEAWTAELFLPLLEVARQTGFEVVEQPLPAGVDDALLARPPGVAICADESVHTSADLDGLMGRYDGVNVKLDKAGGLTQALTMTLAARARGLDVMVGCMVATSLAMAPALLLAPMARWVDLDGPLLLAADRQPGLQIANGMIGAPPVGLWG